MTHCAIYIKGSDEIAYFIRDCVQNGRDFKGSNSSVTGVKAHLFDIKWTDDRAEVGDSVAALTEAKRYQGRVISTEEDVNAVTRELIAALYSPSDEIKMLRLKLAGDDSQWPTYQNCIDGLVKAGRTFKEKEMKNA